MPILTKGSLNVTPMLLKTDLELEDLRRAMSDLKPVAVDLSPGWGSLSDDPGALGALANNYVEAAGMPCIRPGDDLLPEQLEARFYWWEINKSVLRHGQISDNHDAMALNAVDIVFTAGDRGELLAFISTKSDVQLNAYIRPELEQLLSSAGGDGGDSSTALAYDDVDHDFFFWLIYRSQHDPSIDANLHIVDVREAHSEDHAYKRTRLSHGVDLSRGEFLALLSQNSTKFGPVKLTVGSSSPDFLLDCELDFDRKFSVMRGTSEYDSAPEGTTSERLGVLLAMQLAHNTYPDLLEAWRGDSHWTAEARESFREESRESLANAVLQAGVTRVQCQNCGSTNSAP